MKYPPPKQYLLFFLCASLLLACKGKSVVKEPVPDFHTMLGKISNNIVCLKNNGVSYALYLPAAYDSNKSWPVLYCFDSHGDGSFPVKLFQEGAEKFGYILAGSNNSKNGQSADMNLSFYDEMSKDIMFRFHCDGNRQYTVGFSGGSRVASSVALSRGGIRGVVGCSAGFPNLQSMPRTAFDYLGVAGNEDFNLMEMTQLMKALESSAIMHFLLVFDGKHAWPPAATIRDIFSWLEIKAMKNNLKPTDQAFISGVADSLGIRLNKEIEKKEWLQSLFLSEMGAHYLEGFPFSQTFQQKMKELMDKEEVKKAIISDQKLVQKEGELQKIYGEAVQTKDLDWWNKEVSKMNSIIKKGNPKDEVLVYKRTLSYLSLVAFMSANAALKAKQEKALEQFIKIYALVDPENSEHAYLKAVLKSGIGDAVGAISALGEAVKLGFTDAARLRSDSSFVNLHGQKEFEELVKKAENRK